MQLLCSHCAATLERRRQTKRIRESTCLNLLKLPQQSAWTHPGTGRGHAPKFISDTCFILHSSPPPPAAAQTSYSAPPSPPQPPRFLQEFILFFFIYFFFAALQTTLSFALPFFSMQLIFSPTSTDSYSNLSFPISGGSSSHSAGELWQQLRNYVRRAALIHLACVCVLVAVAAAASSVKVRSIAKTNLSRPSISSSPVFRPLPSSGGSQSHHRRHLHDLHLHRHHYRRHRRLLLRFGETALRAGEKTRSPESLKKPLS